MKKMILALMAVAMLSAFAANKFGQPKTIIHVVTVKWKDSAKPDDIKKAVDGVKTLAASYSGIKNVWIKTLKVQGSGYKNAIVMEFKDEKAFKDYVDSDAQKAWYAIYQPIREESTTHDITNE